MFKKSAPETSIPYIDSLRCPAISSSLYSNNVAESYFSCSSRIKALACIVNINGIIYSICDNTAIWFLLRKSFCISLSASSILSCSCKMPIQSTGD